MDNRKKDFSEIEDCKDGHKVIAAIAREASHNAIKQAHEQNVSATYLIGEDIMTVHPDGSKEKIGTVKNDRRKVKVGTRIPFSKSQKA